MSQLKRYPEYKDSGVEWIGEIPKGWQKIKLSRLFIEIGSGGTPNSTNNNYHENGNIKWINTGDLNDGYLNNTKNMITELALKEVSTLKMYPKKSLVVAMYGATIGKLAITNIEAVTNQACCVLSNPINTRIKYMFYWFLTNREDIINSSSGGGQPNISQSLIKSLNVFLPVSLAEQDGIIGFLDYKTSEIDNLISDKERLIKLLEEKRQAVITETVTKGLDLDVKMKDSGIEWIGEIPEHWEIKRLKTISKVELSTADKKTVENEKAVLLCNYVEVYYNNIITRDLDFMKATAKENQINKFQLKKGDILLTKDSEDPNDIAVPAWVSEDMESVLCGYHLAHVTPDNVTHGKYLLYCILSTTFKEQYHSLANGVTRYGILKGDIENSLISVPPLSEQIKISEQLTKIDEDIGVLIKEVRLQISKLKEYRESSIYEAVTGKIDVHDYAVEKEKIY